MSDPAAVAALFAGDPTRDVPSVGVELELHPVRRGGCRREVAPIDETAAAVAGLPHVTFEPGGQLELNPPPSPTAAGAIAAIAELRDAARRRLAPHGVDLLATGLEPWHAADEVALQLRTDRYLAMDAHYAAVGPAGRVFMRQTASTQIGVGLRPGAAGRAQWHAANLVAPLLAAAFANAPMQAGRAVGHNGTRTAIQRLADPGRHRLRWAGRDPIGAYTAFARGARPIGPAFARPSAAAAHRTTLFPPVRPRGTYLELRSIDALDRDDLATAVVLTAALLASRRATAAVLDRLPATDADDDRRWLAAAGPGVRCAPIAAEVVALVDVATDGATDLPAGYLPVDAPERLADLRCRAAAGLAPGDAAAATLAGAGAYGLVGAAIR